jgi:hypothetical protein
MHPHNQKPLCADSRALLYQLKTKLEKDQIDLGSISRPLIAPHWKISITDFNTIL